MGPSNTRISLKLDLIEPQQLNQLYDLIDAETNRPRVGITMNVIEGQNLEELLPDLRNDCLGENAMGLQNFHELGQLLVCDIIMNIEDRFLKEDYSDGPINRGNIMFDHTTKQVVCIDNVCFWEKLTSLNKDDKISSGYNLLLSLATEPSESHPYYRNLELFLQQPLTSPMKQAFQEGIKDKLIDLNQRVSFETLLNLRDTIRSDEHFGGMVIPGFVANQRSEGFIQELFDAIVSIGPMLTNTEKKEAAEK